MKTAQADVGAFVVFEGINGSGKSTSTRIVAEKLLAEGIEAVRTKDHTRSRIGTLIRDLTHDRVSVQQLGQQEFIASYGLDEHGRNMISIALDAASGIKDRVLVAGTVVETLFALDRRNHVEKVIAKEIAAGKAVACDRYIMSNIVAGEEFGMGRSAISELNRGLPWPQLTLLFDVDPAVAMQRIARRQPDRPIFESARLWFHSRTEALAATEALLGRYRQRYLELSTELPNVVVVEGDRNLAAVTEEVMERVHNMLRGRRVLTSPLRV